MKNIMNQCTYNIYCDESRVENPESKNMIIGALFMPRERKEYVVKKIKYIYKNIILVMN